jgi:hypothetical protein
MKTGRLFFVDWPWAAVGLAPGSLWHWADFPCAAQVTASNRPDAAAVVTGAITASHWVLEDVPAAAARWHGVDAASPEQLQRFVDVVVPRRWLLAGQVSVCVRVCVWRSVGGGGGGVCAQKATAHPPALPRPISRPLLPPLPRIGPAQALQPSEEVLVHLGPALDALRSADVVIGLQVRTGWHEVQESSRFLEEGDQYLFVDCVREYVADQVGDGLNVKVVLVSDSDRVRRQVRRPAPALPPSPPSPPPTHTLLSCPPASPARMQGLQTL